MAKKKGQAGDKPAQKPKSLRKQLRKAESGLAKATAKRDKAQARVEALSIIADEIRAQLADIDKAAAMAKAASHPKEEPATKGEEPAARKAAQATRSASPAKRTASARKAASAASRSASATNATGARKRGSTKRKPANGE